MQKVVGGGQQYPPVPEPRWTGDRNIPEVEDFLKDNYSAHWGRASRQVGGMMPNSVKGILGRVAGNVERILDLELRDADATALKATTDDQWFQAFSDTNDVLKTWGGSPQEKAQVSEIQRHWNNEFNALSGDVAGGEGEYMIERAIVVHGTWNDLRVLVAAGNANRFRSTMINSDIDLPGPK